MGRQHRQGELVVDANKVGVKSLDLVVDHDDGGFEAR
jgi:hypothetical protein